jgi:uncharacterized protein (DUF983 family)
MKGAVGRPPLLIWTWTFMENRETSPTHHAPGSTVWAGLMGRCPSCHRGKLFAGYLTLAPRCNVCGLDYDFAESGDGPAVFVILVTGFIVVGAALIVEVLYRPPYWLHALLWGSLALVLPLLLLRAFKGVLIALQFKHKAEEGKLASD